MGMGVQLILVFHQELIWLHISIITIWYKSILIFFSGPTGHPIVSYGPAFTTPLAPAMVGYGSNSSQGVRLTAHSFLTPTASTHSTSGFSSMSVSFMAHPAASYVDAVNPASGQDVVWYPDSGSIHHITNNRVNLQSYVVYTDSKSQLNVKDDALTGATNFPLILVSGEEKLVDQPGGRESLDQPKCHECLKQLQSAEGDNNIGSGSTGSPCVDPINKGVDSSLLGQVDGLQRESIHCSNSKFSNSELGRDEESGSEDRGRGLNSDLNVSKSVDGEVP
ncbi:hypothetical protein V6N11_037048 [Hibiscus sabdariffa]|uniref:Uncharacterized protein n=1 Tax=Hibiscus sabdariffa TaxID=183260 RepID=A0ABR2A978_9ROSI